MHFTKITYLQFDGNCGKNMITYLKTKANFDINIARLQGKIIALFSETFFHKITTKTTYLFQEYVSLSKAGILDIYFPKLFKQTLWA